MTQPESRPTTGTLLIAPPLMEDPNFRRTVVLLCEHGEEGSFGLILNRPLTLHLQDVLDDVLDYDTPLSLGGPVQPNTLHFLHRFGERIPGAVPVLEDVYWGGDFEALKHLLTGERVTGEALRFFLGYAGWSPGQLEEEIEQGGWFLSPASGDVVFAEVPERLWRAVLRRKGGEYAILANFPDDPRLN
ncbi:YqgE/AlgH family protein [Rhodocaloribacter litoris]|uniref:YqgE/AlgH family protein n=1 Tax=Rhodocaloribacter litoris TaxID=2558931 RepID=UPI0014227B7E|nr:YqgE/AlgH family protein [Rhodocaloribacter litoris]QXD16620.1 YqgE/AlgH family protein [Rhodocaloribacter litoris]